MRPPKTMIKHNGGKRERNVRAKPKEGQKNVRKWNQICNGTYDNIRVRTSSIKWPWFFPLAKIQGLDNGYLVLSEEGLDGQEWVKRQSDRKSISRHSYVTQVMCDITLNMFAKERRTGMQAWMTGEHNRIGIVVNEENTNILHEFIPYFYGILRVQGITWWPKFRRPIIIYYSTIIECYQ